eukprot:TRINITY_DN16190_c0_g1_i1.p1 TRINITY_DN16190_c0_g1~~TRINITY_DN16190_c0_g1_i1.p1  ORF type:complete len:240 (+),score=43.61 TRINITY_DN16190_c0_g1_i1:78-797(+)
MPFDLPSNVSPAWSGAAWASALNNRDFQDKQLRLLQYASRGIADCLLRGDPKHRFGLKLLALCSQLSLSRKAFRAVRFFADFRAALNHLRAAWKEGPVRWLQAAQWLLMGVHIFWDNMTFCTHKSIQLVNVENSRFWYYASANLRQKNWRAMADSVGLAAALLLWRRALQGVGRREATYAMLKLAADVATYFPETTAAAWARVGKVDGWRDAYIGLAGCVASLVSCRAEWLKCASRITL